MTVDIGSARTIAYNKESTWGTIATATGATTLRRITSGLGFTKDGFQSQEIKSNFQPRTVRHGIRRVAGDLTGHLILKDYEDFMAAGLRRDFTAVTGYTPTDLVTTTGTMTSAGGDFIAAGFKIGHVVRLASHDAGNANKNFRITAVAAGSMSTPDLLVAVTGPDADAVISLPGKESFNPISSHTSDSFTIEHYHPVSDMSDIFKGCRVGGINLTLPPSDIGQVVFSMVGKDMQLNETGNAPYFTSPTAAGTGQELSGPEGFIRVGGVDQGVVTGMNLNLNWNISGDAVVGATTIPDVFYDVPTLTGQITVFREDQVLLKNFLNEDLIEIHVLLPGFGAAPLGFLSMFMGAVKFTSWSMPDDAKGLIQTFDWTAEQVATSTVKNATALQIQDSEIT